MSVNNTDKLIAQINTVVSGLDVPREDKLSLLVLLTEIGYEFKKAADAIVKLQKQLREEKVDNVNLTGWLAEEHANQCPYYIRNVHDRGDDSLCTKWECEVKVLPKWIPVMERLPDEYVNVLCHLRSLDRKSEYYSIDHLMNDGQWWKAANSWKYEVTHWMPLPKPPEKEE